MSFRPEINTKVGQGQNIVAIALGFCLSLLLLLLLLLLQPDQRAKGKRGVGCASLHFTSFPIPLRKDLTSSGYSGFYRLHSFRIAERLHPELSNGWMHPSHVFLQTPPSQDVPLSSNDLPHRCWRLESRWTASQRIQPPGPSERSTARVCLRMSRFSPQRIITHAALPSGRSEATDVRLLLLLCDIVAHAVIRSSHALPCVILLVQHRFRKSLPVLPLSLV